MSAYYDHVLAAIPLVLLTVPSFLLLNGMGLTTAVPLGTIPALAIIGHALFVRAPTDATPEPLPESNTQPQSAGRSEAAYQ